MKNLRLRQIFISIGAISVGVFLLWIYPTQPSRKSSLELPKVVDFNYHIRPILSQNCYVCHGPDLSSRKASLRLDTEEGATALLKQGRAAIVPGKPHKSSLLQRIRTEDPGLIMPPPEAKKQLSQREIALIEKWIRQGAEYKLHWAFIPPEEPKLPGKLSVSQQVDYLIDQSLKAKHLQPGSRATKYQLIRRVSYLTTGLPPTPEAIEQFVTNDSETAYEEMVNQYLDSQRFGERWARHWMDLVRYGESMGHEMDFNISSPWQYRDYLIRAFNEDVPYDLLVREHLAGDLLPEPRYHPSKHFNESIMGTGYWFLGEGKHSPVNTKLEESERIDNMIDVTSKTFQALTVACAKCHDHKFDPIPTDDYYALYGIIESSRIGPVPARRTRMQEDSFKKLKTIKSSIQTKMSTLLSELEAQPRPQLIQQQKQFIDQLKDSIDYKLIEDFRDGEWGQWQADGWAFGDAPMSRAPVLDEQGVRLTGVLETCASSRFYGKGIQGALRSPNFIIEHDSMLVRARGFNGNIRLVVDNFQVIQYPLYGSLQHHVNQEVWNDYIFDLTLVKGHKAYLQFMSGFYGKGSTHLYRISPDDYIDVAYAAEFNTTRPAVKDPVTSATKLIAEQDAIELPPNLLELIKQEETLAGQLYDSTHVLGLTDGEAVFSPVFIRGSINELSDSLVPHRFFSALPTSSIPFPKEGSGRLAWAEAVVDTQNPLTARVMINRIWHHLFGRGIVETVDNFGLQGKLPTHPELLDFLALQFMEEGWSMKSMIRYLLLTETFQRSTEPLPENAQLDPTNLYLHHFPVRRLEVEAIRDGILEVAGSLDTTMYGPSVPVHLTEFMTGRGRPRHSGPLDGDRRRSIYMAIRRNFIPPMFLAFDYPIPFTTFGNRNTTNVPAQSLTLLNDPFVLDQAQKWAKHMLTKSDLSTEERVREIYLLAFGRAVTKLELDEARQFLQEQANKYKQSGQTVTNDLSIWTDYCHVILNMKEFIYLL